MTFPTIPTGGRVLSNVQANTTATRTFPAMSGLTKNSGDLLIAICIAYQTGTGTDAAFSGWSDGFTEFHDSATSTTMAIGCAYKWSTGSETAAPTVTQAGTITGHAAMFLLSIPGAHPTTPPEAGGRASGTAGTSNPGSFNPGGWDVEDTLWINVGASGETSTTGSYTGINTTNPTNYTNIAETGISADAVGGVEGAVAFRQLAAASEDAAGFTMDTSQARDAAIIIAVRPAPQSATATPSVVSATTAIGTAIVNAAKPAVVAAVATVAALTGNIVPNLNAVASIPTPTITDGTVHATATPSVVSATTSIGSPGISTGNATVTPTRVSAAVSIPTPSVDTGANAWFTEIGGSTPELVVSSEDWAVLCNGVINNGGDYEQTYDDYFTTRAAQGYNAVEVTIFSVVSYEGGNDGPDYDDVYPFTGNSFNPQGGTRNATWWDRRDYFFASAAAHGFRVFCNISSTYLQIGTVTDSWTTAQWQAWGTHIAAKYPESTHPHVFWIVGDDYFASHDSELDALLTVLQANGATQPISMQWYQEASSRQDIYTSTYFTDPNWATDAEYNWGYSYNVSYDVVEKMGLENNTKTPIPYGWMDGYFLSTSATGLTDKQLVRRMVWWALSSGAKSVQVGDNAVYPWSATSYSEVTSNTFYTNVMPAITSFFRTLPNWHLLKADTSNLLVTAGRGTHASALVSGGGATGYTSDSDSYVTASRTPTGSLAVIYMSHGSTITIDQSKMVGGYIARWVDPANGAITSATVGSTYNSTAKGNNSDGQADWVLVLQEPTNATATPAVVAATTTVGAPTITSRATVTPVVVAAVTTIPTPTVTAATSATATPAVVNAVTTIGSPTISSRATATPSVVTGITSVGSPTVTAASSATATPSVVSAVASIPTPTVSVSGNATVTPAVVNAVTAVGSPTVSAASNATVTPSVVPASTSIATPTITSRATATPAVVAASTTIATPTITSSAVVAPAVVAATTSVGAPTVKTGSTVTPSVVAATTLIAAPSVSTSGNVNVVASTVNAVATVGSVTVRTGQTVTAPVVAASASVPAPVITSRATATPTVVAASVTVPTPAVTTSGNANATPTVVAASTTIPTPVITSRATVVAPVVAVITTVPTPTVSISGNATATPSVVAATTSIPAPSVTASGNATVNAGVVAATTAIPAPGISSRATVTPSTVASTSTVDTPVISVGQTISPATVHATTTISVRSVSAGEVTYPTPPGRILTVKRTSRVVNSTGSHRTMRSNQ